MNHALASPRATTRPRREGTPAPDRTFFWSRAALSPRGQMFLGQSWRSAFLLLALSLALPHAATATGVVGTDAPETAGRLRLVQVLEDRVDGVEGLFGARAAAVSPDGAHVYVASEFGDVLAVFARDPSSGRLSFVEMQHNGIAGVDGLGDAREVVVSPDGVHVYVASAGDSALVVFARDAATGRLTFVQVQRDGLPGAGPDYGPVGLAVSPDGAHVYAAGVGDNDVAVLARDGASGTLAPIDVAPIGLPVWPATGAYVRWNPGGVRLSPDGAYVYAVGRNDSAVTAFRRDPATGELTRIGSWKDRVDGVQGLGGAFTLTLSPDGANVYVASAAASALAAFARNPDTGELTFLQVVRDGVDWVRGLAGARDVVVSPDGAHVYATGLIGKSVVLFVRDRDTGRLTYVESRRDVVAKWIGMGEVLAFAISPDGKHLYVPSRSYNALLVFSTDEGGMAPILRCIGDCDGSTQVSVDEVLTGVNIALESAPLSACEMFDYDGNRAVTVDEIVRGVNSVLAGCVDPLIPGDHRRTLVFGGTQRIYDLHIPPNYDSSRLVPLVVDFHGLTSNPTIQAGASGFRELADAEGFVVAYPLGLFGNRVMPEGETGPGPSFNAGPLCCGGAALAGTDDVGFARAIVQAVAAEAKIDRTRVYATGLSNGASMSARLACEAADVFAAVAPVVSVISLVPMSQCQPSRPISVIGFGGLHDPLNPYESFAASFAYWRDVNGCGNGLPDERIDLGTSYCETYHTCNVGVRVELCSVNASQTSYVPGHVPYFNPDIDVARTAWEFLSQFSLPAQ
jgi:poly(3-hydroxybutyrate) depolymerase/6-phosphogluconolactonase (cycloisomerase 2 family)